MYDILKLVLYLIGSLGLGILLLFIFAKVVGVLSAIPDPKEEIYADYMNEANAVNSQAIDILYKIGKPDMSNGTYSPEKMELWEQYYAKEAQAKQMFDEMLLKTQ